MKDIYKNSIEIALLATTFLLLLFQPLPSQSKKGLALNIPPYLQQVQIIDGQNTIRTVDTPFVQLSPDTLIIYPADLPIPPGSGTDTADADNKYWAEGFGIQGVFDGGAIIMAIEKFRNLIVVGGYIHTAGSHFVRNIATWDGSRWSTIGNGVNGLVYDLLVYDDKLYVVGAFRSMDNRIFNNVACWDGEKWHPLRRGVNGYAYAMTVFDNKLIVAGRFNSADGIECNGIAAWDGEHWSALGNGVAPGNYSVSALEIYKNKLIAGGSFISTGNHPASYVASWDGVEWTPLDSGMNGGVWTLSVFQNKLIAAGSFSRVGGLQANYLASWDGTNWTTFGTGADRGISATVVYDDKLIIAGSFSEIDGQPIHNIASWNGSSWVSMDCNVNLHVFDELKVIDSKLYVVGRFNFTIDNPQFSYMVAYWEDGCWNPMTQHGLHDWIFDFEIYNKNLIACGYFEAADDIPTDRVAAWDGEKWHYMSPNNKWWAPDVATAMGLYKNELVVGGWFDTLGGISAKNVAKWDGTTWSAFGGGINIIAGEIIEYNGDLIVGGSAIGNIRYHLSKWDGTTWTTLAQVNYGAISSIRDLIVYDNKLIVAGIFDSINGYPYRGIAQWDGTNWWSVGGEIANRPYVGVYALEIYDGKLIAAGSFDSIGGVPANRIAEWDGRQWVALDTSEFDSQGAIWKMTIHNDKLIVCGNFDRFAGKKANCLAEYDGSSWSSLGDGITTPPEFWFHPNVMSVKSYDDNLYVGGDFYKAGDKISQNFAKWTKKAPLEKQTSDPEAELPNDFILKQNYPNPFNPVTTIEYELTKSGYVVLEIYNILGQRVTTLVDESQAAGSHIVHWNGNSDTGTEVASGIYFYKLAADDKVESRKMILLR